MNITATQITDYCQAHGFDVQDMRTSPSHVILRECPFCPKPHNNKVDNMYKIYVKIGGGAFFCHRCGAKGSWYDFKMKVGGYEVHDSGNQSSNQPTFSSSQNHSSTHQSNNDTYGNGNTNSNNSTHNLPIPSTRLNALCISNLLDQPSKHGDRALEYLTKVRGLEKKTLRKYGVGLKTYSFRSNEPGQHGKYVKSDCVTFPWIMRSSEVNEQENLRGSSFEWDSGDQSNSEKGESAFTEVTQPKHLLDPFVTRRIKARSLDSKGWQRMDPPGGGWGLFGWHTIPQDCKEIIMTEGEYDAMAVYQATGLPAVSLPNGCRSLPMEVLPMLERFEKIYLWMDSDGPGREGAEQFAKKIGISRCWMVDPPFIDGKQAKDANEALLLGMDLTSMLNSATKVPHERIIQFTDIKSQVIYEMMNPEKYNGVPAPSLPTLTNILKGFRRGELSVLTGPTGSGKTTLLGQLSLDFAEQGVNTLWGSFEIKNTRLIQNLLKQFNREHLPEDKEKMLAAVESLADRFESLPMYFMKFHGGSDVDDVLDAMEYATYVHDVQHILLDNLQFMISRNSQSNSFDKFDMQDIALEKFRKFATEMNVHVTLVVHPRKQEESSRLGISSIYGSAKVSQEADNILILQSDGTRKSVEIKKNRYDGTIGHCPLYFQRHSRRYADQPDAQLKQSSPKVARPVVKKPANDTFSSIF